MALTLAVRREPSGGCSRGFRGQTVSGSRRAGTPLHLQSEYHWASTVPLTEYKRLAPAVEITDSIANWMNFNMTMESQKLDWGSRFRKALNMKRQVICSSIPIRERHFGTVWHSLRRSRQNFRSFRIPRNLMVTGTDREMGPLSEVIVKRGAN